MSITDENVGRAVAGSNFEYKGSISHEFQKVCEMWKEKGVVKRNTKEHRAELEHEVSQIVGRVLPYLVRDAVNEYVRKDAFLDELVKRINNKQVYGAKV